MKRIAIAAAVCLLALVAVSVFAAAGTSERTVSNRVYTTYASGTSGAVNMEVNEATPLRVLEVRLHFGAATSGTVALTLDSNRSSAYDVSFVSSAQVAITSYVWSPGAEVGPIVGKDDLFCVDFDNDADKSYGVEVLWQNLGN